jgi:hypothetical protein
MPPTTDDLEAADDEFWAALRHADADSVEAIADADVTINVPMFAAGALQPLLHQLRSGALRIDDVAVERRRRRIVGELATTITTATLTGTRAGAPFRMRLRWVMTWRLADDWVLLSASAAPPREPRSA